MSNTKYLGYYFTVSPLEPGVEILIAELGQAGFESFVETEKGLNAFIQEQDWNKDILHDIYVLQSEEFDISFTQEEIEQINWNKEWEKNFSPIVVDNICSVRAPFHEKPNTPYDIIIEPKMSFGTGHHETTHMMIQHLLDAEIGGKRVLDMGCGTGVLAILSAMKEAKTIDAIDIDNWCYLNTVENAERNNCAHIKAYEGDVSLLKEKKYDIIIANINRNILINDIAEYARCLNPKGKLFLSGFYSEDMLLINNECEKHQLQFLDKKIRNNWVATSYTLK